MKPLVSCLLVMLGIALALPASGSDHTLLGKAKDGTMAFQVPSLGLGCRYKPNLVLHPAWPGEREAALACGRKSPVNQRFVIDYSGGARIEKGRGGLDCCRGGPALSAGLEVQFHSIFACRIEGRNLRCKRADGAAFLVTPDGGHAW